MNVVSFPVAGSSFTMRPFSLPVNHTMPFRVDDEVVRVRSLFDRVALELAGLRIEVRDVVPHLPHEPHAPLLIDERITRTRLVPGRLPRLGLGGIRAAGSSRLRGRGGGESERQCEDGEDGAHGRSPDRYRMELANKYCPEEGGLYTMFNP